MTNNSTSASSSKPAAPIPTPMVDQARRTLRRLGLNDDLCHLPARLLLALPWRAQGFTVLPTSAEHSRLLLMVTRSGIYLAVDAHDAGPALFDRSPYPRPLVWEDALEAVALHGTMGDREDVFAWALGRSASLCEELLAVTDPHLLLTDPRLLDAAVDRAAKARKDAARLAVATVVHESDLCLFIPDNDPTPLTHIQTRLGAYLTGWLNALPNSEFVIFDAEMFDIDAADERDQWLAREYPDYYLA